MKIPLIHFRLMKNITPLVPVCGIIYLVSCTSLVCCARMAHAASAKAVEPVKIGAVLSFSGGVELYGRQAKLGIDLAGKEINAGGGLLGRPIEVVYEDDKTDPTAALDATHKLVERDGVLAVVGPITSRNLGAIVPAIAFLGLSEADLGIFGGKGQNMFVVVPFVATSDKPSVKEFVARTRARSRRRCRSVELCDDALQHADRNKSCDREGRQGRQRIDDRRP